MSSSSRASPKPPLRRVILSVPVPVEHLRVGDCVDFGPKAVPPRVWRVHSIRDGDTRAIQWIPVEPASGMRRRWVGRYASGQILLRVPQVVVRQLRHDVVG